MSDDDDDSQDEDGVRNESVPMILIVVQGGPNTLITVEQSLKQAVPVLILAVWLLLLVLFLLFSRPYLNWLKIIFF